MARYQIMLVERNPNESTGPILTAFDEIVQHEKLTWGESLDGLGFISFALQPDQQSTLVRSRLRDISFQGLEVWLYRDNVIVQAGPLIGLQPQGSTHNAIVRSLTYYLRYMFITTDLSHTAVDQYTIGKGLVDHWQALDYGDFGIDTSGIGTSGVVRTIDYKADEAPNVFRKLENLADADNGFEFFVDPTTRDLTFTARKGSDKSATVIVDERNITSPNAFYSVAAGDFATHAIAIGADVDSTTPVIGVTSGGTPMFNWGRVGHVIAVDGVSTQSVIDEYALNLFNAMNHVDFMPSPTGAGGSGVGTAGSLIPSIDLDPTTVEAGDTITWSYDYGYGIISLARDIWSKTVNIDSSGTETIGLRFV